MNGWIALMLYRQGRQAISPKNLYVVRLVREMGMPRDNDRHQPVPIGHGHQAAGTAQVAGKIFHVIVEGAVVEPRGKRISLLQIDPVAEDAGIAEGHMKG